MLDPDKKIDANSTWESLPRRQLLLKFFASIALIAFLVGMMLGRLVNPPVPPEFPNRVEQLQRYTDGLAVCLKRATQVQVNQQQGAYQLVFMSTSGSPAQGEIQLADQQVIRWRVQPEAEAVRVVFAGVQPIVGQWYPRSTDQHWCADIRIQLATDTAFE